MNIPHGVTPKPVMDARDIIDEDKRLLLRRRSLLQQTSADLPPGYAWPDFDAALDLEHEIALLPKGSTAKGMFLKRLALDLSRRGKSFSSRKAYQAFSDYSLEECVRCNVEAAQALYPSLPLREGLRRIAWLSFDTFGASMIGGVTLAAVRHEPAAIFRLADHALSFAISTGTHRTEVLDSHTIAVHAHDVHFFPDSFGLGVAEGVLRSCRRIGSVALKKHSPTRYTYLVRWV